MALLTREQILGAGNIATIEVEVPEWGGSVRIRDMGADARDRLMQFYMDRKNADGGLADAWHYKVLVCALSICDDKDELLFSEDDIALLARKGGRTLDVVYVAAADFNALSAKRVEEEEKNSSSPRDDSGSGLLDTSGAQ